MPGRAVTAASSKRGGHPDRWIVHSAGNAKTGALLRPAALAILAGRPFQDADGYPCGFMALMETVTASICNAGHSQSWSRNWHSAGAMITMDRGGSLMKAAGHDQ